MMHDSNQDSARNSSPTLWIVVPCFNEQEVLPITAPMFLQKINELIDEGKVSEKSTVCFVDDGSKDDTWEIIQNLAATQKCCEGLSLSRNRGHQNALLAGLMEARLHADAVISMDCDGQDDISAIDEMLDKHRAGAEIVYGVRSSRDSDTAFKRMSAEAFYKLLDKMEEIVVGECAVCQAGDTHYPFKKMCALAINGITSLSIKPIRIISGLGIAFSLIGFAGIIWALVSLIIGSNVTGWVSLVCMISLLGGVQLLALGVIGEYIGKIYLEVKERPRYIIEKRTWE